MRLGINFSTALTLVLGSPASSRLVLPAFLPRERCLRFFSRKAAGVLAGCEALVAAEPQRRMAVVASYFTSLDSSKKASISSVSLEDMVHMEEHSLLHL